MGGETARGVWTPLFDGKSTKGWTHKGGGEWSVDGGVLHVKSVRGDQRHGLIVSRQAYGDFIVRFKVKLLKGNSGLLLRMDSRTGTSYEVEMDAALHSGDLFETNGRNWLAGARSVSTFRANDWNEIVVQAQDHCLVVFVNGLRLTECLNDRQGRTEGLIALEIPRDGEAMFKDIEIAVLGEQARNH